MKGKNVGETWWEQGLGPQIMSVQHNTVAVVATGPTYIRNMASSLIPVLIGLVSRHGMERSITDVSSRCGRGSETG